MKNRIDLKKVKSIYEIAGSWIWQYGRCQLQYKWCRDNNIPYLINEYSGEKIKSLKNIKKYCELNNLEMEM